MLISHVRESMKKETMPETSPEGKLSIGKGDIYEQDKEK
jgi:hypothetical protein